VTGKHKQKKNVPRASTRAQNQDILSHFLEKRNRGEGWDDFRGSCAGGGELKETLEFAGEEE